jgi:hypothetical protein
MFKKGEKHPVAKKGAVKKRVHKPLPVFKPPEDFRSAYIRVILKTDKDGILGNCRCIYYKGRPGTASEKSLPMSSFDPDTQMRVAMRLAGANFIRSEPRRLPPNSQAMLLVRVGVKTTTGGLSTAVREIKFKEGKAGKTKTLARKNPLFRALRKANRILPGAFTSIQLFPSNKEYTALTKKPEGAEE